MTCIVDISLLYQPSWCLLKRLLDKVGMASGMEVMHRPKSIDLPLPRQSDHCYCRVSILSTAQTNALSPLWLPFQREPASHSVGSWIYWFPTIMIGEAILTGFVFWLQVCLPFPHFFCQHYHLPLGHSQNAVVFLTASLSTRKLIS